MENNEYQTTSYVEYENQPKETEKKTETTSASNEEQYYDLPFKERMKIHKNRMKLKLKAKSQDLKAKAKAKSEKIRVRSKEINEKIRAKIETHKAHQRHYQHHVVPKNQQPKDIPPSEPSKYCSECGVEVTPSGKFCPACGAIH